MSVWRPHIARAALGRGDDEGSLSGSAGSVDRPEWVAASFNTGRPGLPGAATLDGAFPARSPKLENELSFTLKRHNLSDQG